MDNETRSKLERIHDDVKKCLSYIEGDEGHDGIRLDVDRLKRARKTHNAILWVIFTVGLGVVGTVVASLVAQHH